MSIIANKLYLAIRFELRDLGFQPFARDRKHRLAKIQCDDLRAFSRERERHVASATAQIQRAFAGLNLGQPDQSALPVPVQAEALKVIDQVVAPRNGPKQIAEFGRALFAGIVILVDHAPVNVTGIVPS